MIGSIQGGRTLLSTLHARKYMVELKGEEAKGSGRFIPLNRSASFTIDTEVQTRVAQMVCAIERVGQ
jgi:hypothetical protein